MDKIFVDVSKTTKSTKILVLENFRLYSIQMAYCDIKKFNIFDKMMNMQILYCKANIFYYILYGACIRKEWLHYEHMHYILIKIVYIQ